MTGTKFAPEPTDANYHLLGRVRTEPDNVYPVGFLLEVYRCQLCGAALVEYYSVGWRAGRDSHDLLHEPRRQRRRRLRRERRTRPLDYP
jgi:hypothetical protein